MVKKQVRAIIELVLGLGLGIPSIEQIFQGVFLEMFKSGNYFAVIGIIVSALVGIILTLDTFAILLGFKNLGDLFEYLEED